MTKWFDGQGVDMDAHPPSDFQTPRRRLPTVTDQKTRTLLRHLTTVIDTTTQLRDRLMQNTTLTTWLDVDAGVAEIRKVCDEIDNLMPRTSAESAKEIP